MKQPFVYRTYRTGGDPSVVRTRLIDDLTAVGYVFTGSENGVDQLAYPKLTFSSKRPLTCASRLLVRTEGTLDNVRVGIGASFTKIRWFTILAMLLVCAIIPAGLSYLQRGTLEIPTPAWAGIPLGFMLHYHVRWRTFTALRRLVFAAGEYARRVQPTHQPSSPKKGG